MTTPMDRLTTENKKQAARTCPKNGHRAERMGKRRWVSWTFPLVGAVAFLWFLIRVIPKPSRAAYPCQRAAFPLASGFVVWLTGLVLAGLAYGRAKRLAAQGRYLAAGGFAAVAVVFAIVDWANSIPSARAEFVPTDPANSPIGVGKGIHPGRVAWIRDQNATKWDGVTGHWWDDQNVDQRAVDEMLSHVLWALTGQQDDAAAWNALFRHFNRTHGAGDVGYQPGEKIAIKINLNEEGYGPAYGGNGRMPSPQVIRSLLAQLFDKAHVAGANITIYDASRAIADPLYNRIHGEPDPNFQNVRFVANTTGNGRIGAVHDLAVPVHFASPNVSPPNNATAYLPTCVTEAKYLIDLALFSGHSMFGVTACGKNWFGSVGWRTNANYGSWNGGWTPSPLHNFGMRNNPMGTYNPIVDLVGHPQLGGKTLLFLVDGLYGSDNAITPVLRFRSFDNNWTASVFASQDPVAIDSVVVDFLRNEPLLTNFCTGQGVDNYLHEAAQADNPSSRSFYDPASTGSRLASLGVHEHWNNARDKQYSRNLGRSEGIELVTGPTALAITAQPASIAVESGATGRIFAISATGTPTPAIQWQRNGMDLPGQTEVGLVLNNIQPADAGVYRAIVTNASGSLASEGAILGVVTAAKVIGAGAELSPADIRHPNGSIFDQVLLTGDAEAITADPGQITRTSYIDLNDDIVQVEFTGKGTLSLVLDSRSGPARPVNYNQAQNYMKGHAGIIITGADETTNVSVFTVGRVTAFDPTGVYNFLQSISETNNPANNGSSLFVGHAATAYDGVADFAFIAISSPTGKFGGLRASDASCFASQGLTGIYAPGIQFTGPVFISDVYATGTATPMFIIGSSPDTRITGGNLLQANAQPVQVRGLTQLRFTPGGTSNNVSLPAQANQAVLQQDGVDVTSQVVVNPPSP